MTPQDVLKMAEDNNVEMVDLSFVVEPTKPWVESQTELERAITQKATHEIRQKLEKALMEGMPKPGEWAPIGQGVNVARTQQEMAAEEKYLGAMGFGGPMSYVDQKPDGITSTADNGDGEN